MEITEKEKKLILKLRKEKEDSVKSDSFVNLINELRDKADKQIELVKEMSVHNAVDESKGEKGYSPLRMIYERDGEYLHSYGYSARTGVPFYKNLTKEQKKSFK
jgi:hypothetical protein